MSFFFFDDGVGVVGIEPPPPPPHVRKDLLHGLALHLYGMYSLNSLATLLYEAFMSSLRVTFDTGSPADAVVPNVEAPDAAFAADLM